MQTLESSLTTPAPCRKIIQQRLAAIYCSQLQRELISAKLGGTKIIESARLIRGLRLHAKRPSISREILAIALNELPNRSFLPEVA